MISCNKVDTKIIPYIEYKYNENGRVIIPNKGQLKLIPKDGGKMWNRLVFEKSPYLLQHAANPVDWFPWSEEVFKIAKELDKPVFLSIGYITCHWCHVMEHESFEDSLVASLMNDAFVNIKVDREERPDIDNIYMEVTQMVTGRGGWPMTVIMTPDKKPFFAGTYFPKSSRGGRAGMIDLIPQINKLWMEKQDSLLTSADKITNSLHERNQYGLNTIDLSYLKIMDAAFNSFKNNFDDRYGGFKNSRNKFPKPHDYSFLMRYYNRTNNEKSLKIVEKSLYAMKKGGIYDQIGFGFHRYSTDTKWLVPHFEKMLYDQALLIHAYLDAYLLTNDIYYSRTVDEVSEYIIRDMYDRQGGFYSAEDADSKGEEGTFYIWNVLELKKILTNEEFKYIYDILNFNDKGNCRVEGHYTNIPHFSMSWNEIGEKYNITSEEAYDNFNNIRIKIFNYRENRIHPQKDDKILTDWNGLMISALSRAGSILDNHRYIDYAKKGADFILDNLMEEDGKLKKSYRNGPANIDGMIEDYAFFIWGLIELYQSTFEEKYIDAALLLSNYQINHFWDNDKGGFFFISDESDDLLIRKKEIYDGAIPSGNSVSAYNFIKLSRILSKPEFEEITFKIIDTFSNNLNRYSSGYTMLLHALDFAQGPSYEVIITGKEEKIRPYMISLYKSKQFNKVLIFKNRDKYSKNSNFLFLNNYDFEDNGDPLIYVCKNYVCDLPTSDIEIVLSSLENK